MPEELEPTYQIAIVTALDELRHWPDLPGIPYYTYTPGDTEKRKQQINPGEVQGIFTAMYKHTLTLFPFAKECYAAKSELIHARYKIQSLEERIRELELQREDEAMEAKERGERNDGD